MASERFGLRRFLKRGDNVVATSRKLENLKGLSEKYPETLLPLALDVTDKAACIEVVSKAKAHFGSIDVVINNAGYCVFGAVEENSEQEAKDLFDTNVFGTLWMSQAILPVFRDQVRR